jgi:acetate kinase
MGFTPLDGIMMATRSGSVDPGILVYALREKGLDVDQLDRALNHESGLLGVSGLSSDMRELLAAYSKNSNARMAIDLYVHRIRQTIGAMAATLGGVDGLVFTAGVGERAALIREMVCRDLEFLGLNLDRELNANCKPDADVSQAASAGRILVLATCENLTIMRESRQLLAEKRPEAKASSKIPVRR